MHSCAQLERNFQKRNKVILHNLGVSINWTGVCRPEWDGNRKHPQIPKTYETSHWIKTIRVQHPQAMRDAASNVTAGESIQKAHIGISDSDCVNSRTQSSSKHKNSSFPEPRLYHTSIERLVSFIRRSGSNWAEEKAVRNVEGWVEVTDGADWSGRR